MELPKGLTEAYREQLLRERKVHEEIGRAPLQTLTGVVSPLGACCGRRQGEPWKLWFWLAAWRVAGGPLSHRKLKVYKCGQERSVEKESKKIERCTLVTMRAHVLVENELAEPQAILVGMPASTTDAEFDDLIRELTTPIVVRHDRFGDFALDQHRTTFEGRTVWRGADVRVSIDGESAEECRAGLVTLAAVVANTDWWHEWMKQEVAPRVMKILHDWAEEDFPAPSEQELLDVLALENISIYQDGNIELFYDFGDFAGGHGLLVKTSLTGVYKDDELLG